MYECDWNAGDDGDDVAAAAADTVVGMTYDVMHQIISLLVHKSLRA